MKITLKQDWDITSQPPSRITNRDKGHFIGRKKELSILFNELLRREQGAILVSGHRGVGKTSFVYKVLQDVFEYYGDKKVLAVLINSNHLDEQKKDSIIVNLIRRLYAVSLEENLPSDLVREIEILYKKAVSVDFRHIEKFERGEETTKETQSTSTVIAGIDKIEIGQLIWFTCFVIAILLQLSPLPGIANGFNKILPILFAFPIPFFASYVWQYNKTLKKASHDSNSAQRLYTLDNNISNLEFDLDRLHRRLNHKGVKTIYVLDELDKLTVKKVSEILKYFKNLFTLSSAIFVFIGSEELSEIGKPNDKSIWERPLEYTYFTSKYYLSRPSADELSDYLEEIAVTCLENYDQVK